MNRGGSLTTNAAQPSTPESQVSLRHIPELDGLRGLAVLMVISHHFWPSIHSHSGLESVAHLGWVGVDLFFVISGFLITCILLDTRGQPGFCRNFYWRRAIRIFPLYYAFLVAAFTIIPWMQGGNYWETDFLRESGSPIWYLLYLGNAREMATGVEPAYILAPLWSLCIEEQFYVGFPLVVAALAPGRLWQFLIGLLFLAPAFRTVAAILAPENCRIQYLCTLSRVDVLALGGIVGLMFRTEGKWLPQPRTIARMLLLALGACVIAFQFSGFDRTQFFCRTLGYSLVGFTSTLLVIWIVQNRGRLTTAWLRFQPLRNLGIICYGIYLLQRPADIVLGKLLQVMDIPFDRTTFGGMLERCGATLVMALISWYCFEKPLLRFKRSFKTCTNPILPEAFAQPAITAENGHAAKRKFGSDVNVNLNGVENVQGAIRISLDTVIG